MKRDGSFPLARILEATIPAAKSPTSRLYFASKISEIDRDALIYFGASVFWRGSIHPWNDDGTIPVKLGQIQETFRRFLNNDGAFPINCVLIIMVRDGTEMDKATFPPYGGRTSTFQTFKFIMPGLAFWLVFGDAFPAQFLSCCFVNHPGNPIIVTSIIEDFIRQDATRMKELGSGRPEK
jgi:hypothetical protein